MQPKMRFWGDECVETERPAGSAEPVGKALDSSSVSSVSATKIGCWSSAIMSRRSDSEILSPETR